VVETRFERLDDFDVLLRLSGVAMRQQQQLQQPVPLHTGKRSGFRVHVRDDWYLQLIGLDAAREEMFERFDNGWRLLSKQTSVQHCSIVIGMCERTRTGRDVFAVSNLHFCAGFDFLSMLHARYLSA
jgi:hypothetical protein